MQSDTSLEIEAFPLLFCNYVKITSQLRNTEQANPYLPDKFSVLVLA